MSRPTGFTPKVRRIVLERSAGMCERDYCGPVAQIHHRAPRGSGGTSLGWINQAANAFGLSSGCHHRIELRREEALRCGWLVPRNQSRIAAEVPVLRQGVWVLLGDDGSINEINQETK